MEITNPVHAPMMPSTCSAVRFIIRQPFLIEFLQPGTKPPRPCYTTIVLTLFYRRFILIKKFFFTVLLTALVLGFILAVVARL